MLSNWVRERLAQLDQLALSRTVSYEDLYHFNKALRIAAGMELDDIAKSTASGIGYGLQGTAFDSQTVTGGDYAPLATQSIQPIVDNLTYTADELMFMRLLTTAGASTTVHEYVQRESYGEEGTTIFVNEGSVAPVSKSKFRRRTVDIKYLMEVREYTDVANTINYMGVNGSARAIELQDGALNFSKKIENACLWASSALNPLAFDGLFPSIEARDSTRVIDMRGTLPTPQEINGFATWLASPPNHAKVTHILTSFAVKQAFVNQSIPFTRTPGFQNSGRNLDYTLDGIFFQAGDRKVPMTVIPYFDHKQHPAVRSVGEKAPPALVGPLAPSLASVVNPSGVNKWTTAETNSDWDYYYWVEAHGDGGYSVSGVVGPVTPTDSTKVTRVDIADGTIDFDGDNGIKYYSLYRARVRAGEAAPSTSDAFFWIGDYPRNKDNGGATRFYDRNHTLPDTSNILIAEISPRVMQWTSLLDMYMRPLFREMATTNPFALVKFGSFTLKQETKVLWFKNVKRTA